MPRCRSRSEPGREPQQIMGKRRKKRRASSRPSTRSIRHGVGTMIFVVVMVSLGLLALSAARNASWTGVAITVALFGGELILTGGDVSRCGLGTGLGGMFGAIIMLGLAMILTAARALVWGAYCGAIGWAVFITTSAVWGLTGWDWFP